jgi:hypothetical protein
MSNQEQKPRIYCGNGKKVEGYDLINVSLEIEKLTANQYEYNGKKRVNITVGSRKEPNEYGQTHNAWIREIPNQNNSNNNQQTSAPKAEPLPQGTGLPF